MSAYPEWSEEHKNLTVLGLPYKTTFLDGQLYTLKVFKVKDEKYIVAVDIGIIPSFTNIILQEFDLNEEEARLLYKKYEENLIEYVVESVL